MASTNHPKTFSDLYTSLLNNVRADSSVTATKNEAKRMINTALHDMHIDNGEHFPWCQRRAVLRTKADYTTGTVTVTSGSTSVTGSSTEWATDAGFGDNNAEVGDYFTLGSNSEIYSISTVSSDAAIVLGSKYVGSTTSGASYTIYKDEYALAADFLRPVDYRAFDAGCEIPIIGRRMFDMRFPRNSHTGSTPKACCIIDLPFNASTTPVRKVKIHPAPSEVYQIPYWYVSSYLAVQTDGTEATELANDDDEPIVPLRYRHLILYHALEAWYRDRADDARADHYLMMYERVKGRLEGAVEIGHDRPRFQPVISPYMGRSRIPYRRGRTNRRFPNADAFDSMRE